MVLKDRKFFLIFLIIVFGIILFINSFLIRPKVIEITPLPAQVSESSPSQTQLPENETMTIILVGDIMLDRGVEYMRKTEGKGDFRFPFLKIADELKEAKRGARLGREGGGGIGVLFGNLEGPISDKGTKVGSIYSFRNDPKSIEGLTFAGFDVISLANNHVFDYGREALEDTLLRLKTAGIDYLGAGFNEKEAYSPIIKELNDTKIAFLVYTNLGPETWKAGEENSGIAWISENNLETIKRDIEKVKKESDILIVSLHSGEEYQKTPTQFQIEFSRAFIDAGADLVIGHHPHIIQPNEKYKDGWIFYSLGNFVFDQNFSEETMRGQILKILIENNKIKEVVPINIKINNFFQPEIIQ